MSVISRSGIASGQIIKSEHFLRVIKALDGTDITDIIVTGSLTANSVTGSFTGSFKGDGSQLTGITGEWDGTHVGNASITGSLTVTNGITGSLSGSATNATSASYALTASYALNGGGGSAFPYTGSAIISGSLVVTGSFNGLTIGIGKGNIVSNTAIGYLAFNSNTTGVNNIALGTYPLYYNTIGTNNIALGSSALYYNTTGARNIALGTRALFNTSGSGNIAQGFRAGYNALSSSSYNIYLGNEAGPSSSTLENNKLYIASGSGTPLIGGDFASGSVTINNILTLNRRTTTPALPIEGMIIASGSAGSSVLYYYNGTSWNALF